MVQLKFLFETAHQGVNVRAPLGEIPIHMCMIQIKVLKVNDNFLKLTILIRWILEISQLWGSDYFSSSQWFDDFNWLQS